MKKDNLVCCVCGGNTEGGLLVRKGMDDLSINEDRSYCRKHQDVFFYNMEHEPHFVNCPKCGTSMTKFTGYWKCKRCKHRMGYVYWGWYDPKKVADQ